MKDEKSMIDAIPRDGFLDISEGGSIAKPTNEGVSSEEDWGVNL